MTHLFLGGMGDGDWLPFLWVLIAIGALLQIGDWLLKLVREKRRRKVERLAQINFQDEESNLIDNSVN